MHSQKLIKTACVLASGYSTQAQDLAITKVKIIDVASGTTLQAATVNAAQLLGTEESMGALGVGKLADVVLLRGNPLDQMSSVRQIEAVVADGQLFERERLHEMLKISTKPAQCGKSAREKRHEGAIPLPSYCSRH
ncbi:hypothetical protein CDD81_51 [Ophiocordyceps australis]|uniref:Amidohydrolase-related domain-containing protein n=1 Tax=Ophiocordyceps australis TaxID=1399860 RepID=A0A2C5XCL6_9HYPO|nr:hypothetical protein CDD81_51 [Ophiocordyceps australis]